MPTATKKKTKKRTAKQKQSRAMQPVPLLDPKKLRSYYTAEEVAEKCGVTKHTVLYWIRQGKLDGVVRNKESNGRGAKYFIKKKGFKRPE